MRSPRAGLAFALALLVTCAAVVVDSVLVGVGLAAKHASDEFVRQPSALDASGIPNRSVLLARDGTPFAYFWSQNRSSVPGSAMAPVLRRAVVAIEDARFYDNAGVDLTAISRAVWHNATSQDRQGGSTITQQYVKNLLLLRAASAEGRRAATADSYHRKLAEARVALELTRRMSKDDILTGYLNLVYFGRRSFGVQAAAETYFDTDARSLTLSQAALLAGLVKGPAAFDPFTHPAAARSRRNAVLEAMRGTGAASDAAVRAAQAAPLGLHDGAKRAGCYGSPDGYFCDYVLRQLLADPGLGATLGDRERRLDTGGLVVRTTLDRRVAASTQRAVDRARGSRAAVATAVVQPGTGAVLAMTASVPFGVQRGQSSVNLPLGGSSGYQAGSTFKLFVLTQAIKDGIPLSLRLYAPQRYTSRRYAPYSVGNAADSESGVFSLEEATWHSVNTYYLQLEERVGFTGPADIAESMGVRRADGSPLHRVPSFTLGTSEVTPLAMAGAVATYAAHGLYCRPHAVLTVSGVRAKPVAPCRRVLSPAVADTVTRVLSGVIREGTGVKAAVPGDAAGKTGTVQDFSAAWFVGYTPRYAAAVWMGDPRGGFAHPLTNLTVGAHRYARMYGGDGPAQVWAALVRGAPGGATGQRFVLAAPPPATGSTQSGPAVSGVSPGTVRRPGHGHGHKHG